MKFNHLSPMLYTKDIKDTIDFYVSTFGFTCVDHSEEWGWAIVAKDNVEIMMCLPNKHIPFDRPNFTGSLYINTTNVDELWEQVKIKTKICYPLENFEYGMKEFAVYDNNGYLIQFGENIPAAS